MVLESIHLSKSFGDNRVLKDINFSLQKGKIYLLIGTNGSGKTTLFNILSGFLKSDSGEIKLNNKTIIKQNSFNINRLGITRTFQDLRLIKTLTVLENILLSFSNQEGEKWYKNILPSKKIKAEQLLNREKALQIAKSCFIEDVINSKADEISYGQQKLLNLACSIANDAQIFLLDEPVAGVNPHYREKLVEIIKKLKKDGKTFLIIEHNSDFIEMVSDEILFLHLGEITEYSDYQSMREDDFVKEAYI